MKLRILRSSGALLALALTCSACGGGGGDDDDSEGSPSNQGPRDAAVGNSQVDAGATDPFAGLLGGLLGDGGLSGITSLLGDGGLAGITSLFGDAGFGGFLDGGFDTSALCARAPQFCPDAAATVQDAGPSAGDASAADAGAPDASDGGSSDAGSSDASSAGDASNEGDGASAEAGS